MYHDQGLIPFKTLSFGQGVNFTASKKSFSWKTQAFVRNFYMIIILPINTYVIVLPENSSTFLRVGDARRRTYLTVRTF